MPPTASVARVDRESESTHQPVLAAQLKLLYYNANLGIAVTVLAAALLGTLQWQVISHSAIAGWWLYMAVISVLRYAFVHIAKRRSLDDRRNLYTLGIALTGIGWGVSGVLLYAPTTSPTSSFSSLSSAA